MKRLFLNLLCLCALALPGTIGIAQSLEEFKQSVEALKRLRGAIQRETHTLLVLLKHVDSNRTAGQDRVVVNTSTGKVLESNIQGARVIFAARLHDEYPSLEKRDEWYRIRLPDQREGWMSERDVQFIPARAGVQMETDDILGFCNGIKEGILARYDSTQVLLATIDETYGKLPPGEKSQATGLFASIPQERGRITEYVEYAIHFYMKYAARTGTGVAQETIPVNGQVNFQMGNSAYNASYNPDLKQSIGSRSIDLTGSARLTDQSTLSALFNNKSTIIQSPFSSNDLKLGYAYQQPGGTGVSSHVSYASYTDSVLSGNNFSHLGTSVSLFHPLAAETEVTADLRYDRRDYAENTGSNYGGIEFLSQLKWRPNPQTDWSFGVNGALQSSDISYLNFNRFIPRAQYLSRNGGESFGLKAEGEFLFYTQEANSNDYMREQLDLIWMTPGTQRQMTFSARQFPRNNSMDYVRFNGILRWNGSDPMSPSRSSVSLLYNYFTNPLPTQIDYTDTRLDHSSRGQDVYLEYNVYNRYWLAEDDSLARDHIIDAYARCGLIYSPVQIGPIIGAHLLARRGLPFIKRDGNSLRAGIEASAHFLFYTALVSVSLRYEKNFVYGNEISIDQNTGVTVEGALRERHPTTLQFSGQVRVPVLPMLDFTLDVNRYDIHADVDNATSINPFERRYQFNILAGLGYRFAL